MDIKVLQKDMIAAMKARDKARKESISALIQAVKKAGIDAGCREDIPEEMVNKVILKELKTVKEPVSYTHLASICEVRHDDYGPIWPITIAPWQVHLCCLRSDDAECKEFADNLYNTLQNKGIEVIYDDRKARPGAMFADADLLGVPVRVVVSPRNLKESVVELSTRDKSIQKKVPMNEIEQEVDNVIKQLTDSIYEKVK